MLKRVLDPRLGGGTGEPVVVLRGEPLQRLAAAAVARVQRPHLVHLRARVLPVGHPCAAVRVLLRVALVAVRAPARVVQLAVVVRIRVRRLLVQRVAHDLVLHPGHLRQKLVARWVDRRPARVRQREAHRVQPVKRRHDLVVHVAGRCRPGHLPTGHLVHADPHRPLALVPVQLVVAVRRVQSLPKVRQVARGVACAHVPTVVAVGQTGVLGLVRRRDGAAGHR